MANQQSIATALGLSIATVSRALRGRGNHDAGTRALVLEEAEKQGYRLPRRSDLSSGAPPRMPVIAVVLAAAHPRHGELPTVALRLLHGISARARAAGLMLHVEYLAQGGAQAAHDPADSPALRNGAVDGLVVIGDLPARSLGALAKRLPIVRIVLREPGIPLDTIGQDDLAAIGELLAHLQGLGHRRIGFLGDGTSRTFIHARAAAFRQAMLEQDDPSAPVVGVGREVLAPEACGEQVLAHIAQGTTAWICIHDRRGYDLVRVLRERGVQVPQEIAVCAFDALPTPHGLPTMTTIDWPFEEMGGEAVTRLLARLEAPEAPVRTIALPGRLVIGETTTTGPGEARGQSQP